MEATPPPSRDLEAWREYPYTAMPSPRTDEVRRETVHGTATSASLPTIMESGNGGPGAGGSKLKLSRPAYTTKTGWEMSGRVGPLRWLNPLDGEGETRVRLGGRVPGQPRMPGTGLLSVGIHYNFE